MNKVILLGRLTKDPDVRRSQGAEPVTIARYTLAVNRRGKKQEGQQDGTGQQGSWEQSAMDGFLNIPDGIDEELPFN